MSPQNKTLRIMTPSMAQSMTVTPTQALPAMTPEVTKEQNKQCLKNIVDLVTEGFVQKKLKPENFLENLTKKNNPVTKWHTSTGAIVKVLFDLEIEFDETITYPEIRQQILMD
jgi:hypothetical protein